MEHRNDKIVQEKINSLRGLPEGYSPSLNSKWELIEAGLSPGKKIRFPLWKIAAVIVLLFGGGILLVERVPKTPVAATPAPVRATTIITEKKIVQPLQVSSKNAKGIKSGVAIKHTKKTQYTAVIEVPNTILPPDTAAKTVPAKTAGIISLQLNKPKTSRFTEMDFEPEQPKPQVALRKIPAANIKVGSGITQKDEADHNGSGGLLQLRF